MPSKTVTVKGQTLKEGDWITIDGAAGIVMLGQVPTIDPVLSGDFATLMGWADKKRRLKVRTNAETPLDANAALGFGAQGIGLCRTEHMFFQDDRILAMREMILSADVDGRRKALAKIAPYAARRFRRALRDHDAACRSLSACSIRRCTSSCRMAAPRPRLWPRRPASTSSWSAAGWPSSGKPTRCSACAVAGSASSIPEIYEMQARAIFEAAIVVFEKSGETVTPEVMIPLVCSSKELALIKKRIVAVAEAVAKERGHELHYEIGTMIELPRAALRAREIAEHAQFFSFGTNDLTQMTLGLSRDDAGSFLETYLAEEIFASDPFQSLDQDGVGELVALAAERGRAARPEIKLGICGEHGGDPASIDFCHRQGLDYVSCSPYRVPIARLAAAQAALSEARGGQQQRDR